MQDARISTGLPSHPKTKKLIRRIGEGGAYRLVVLFLWAAANRPDGDLSGMTDEDIELAVDWSGDEGAFVRALVEVGFLDGEPGVYSIHDWSDHNPWAAGAEARSEKSRWAALCKRHGRPTAAAMMPDYARRLADASQQSASGMPESASGTRLADSGSAPSPSPSPLPSPKAKASSLRSDSSPADAEDRPPDGGKVSHLQQRLAAVTDDAIETYNARLGKPNGLLPRVAIMTDVRRKEVKRCLAVAKEICKAMYGAERIDRQFWVDYWAAVDADDFHAGRLPGGKGHEGWTPDFEFLTRADVMAKLFDRAVSADEAQA